MTDSNAYPGHSLKRHCVRIGDKVKWFIRCECGFETELANTPESAIAIMLVQHMEDLYKGSDNNDTD